MHGKHVQQDGALEAGPHEEMHPCTAEGRLASWRQPTRQCSLERAPWPLERAVCSMIGRAAARGSRQHHGRKALADGFLSWLAHWVLAHIDVQQGAGQVRIANGANLVGRQKGRAGGGGGAGERGVCSDVRRRMGVGWALRRRAAARLRAAGGRPAPTPRGGSTAARGTHSVAPAALALPAQSRLRTSWPSTRVASLPPDAVKVISSPLRKRASSNWRVNSARAPSSPACA